MHKTSANSMKRFIDKYLNKEDLLSILDVGSMNVCTGVWKHKDGMKFLLKDVCEFELLKVFIESHDCIGIARKVKP